MATRSPWRDRNINLCFGAELPVLLRHDLTPRSAARDKWRPIVNQVGINKPAGGLLTAPAILPEGKWRPIPRRSTWTEFCASEMPHMINHGWQTQIFPDPGATFAVIDKAADAAALHAAFPGATLQVTMASFGIELPSVLPEEKVIDWQAMLATGVSGVYLTEQGQRETRFPEDRSAVPSLYGWDYAQVWFGRPSFRVGQTWKCPPIPVDPYGDGWDNAPPRVQFRRNSEELRRMAAEVEEEAGDEQPE